MSCFVRGRLRGAAIARTVESTAGGKIICFFFLWLCPITPACVNVATKFGSSTDNILWLAGRLDKSIGFLNREVDDGSSFYIGTRGAQALNANVQCTARDRLPSQIENQFISLMRSFQSSRI